MDIIEVSNNFSLEEFIHPAILKRVGDRSLDFLHPQLVLTIQALRDKFGRITINNWLWDGKFKDSGLRLPLGELGAGMSSHKFGCAADCKFSDVEPIEVQTYIIRHQSEFPSIVRLENALVTKTWLHVEVGVRYGSVKVFNP